MSKIGPKEAALRQQRSDLISIDGEIPKAFRRTETPEQAEARRAKLRKPDSSAGLKVVTPYNPPPEAVRKAIAKDLSGDEPSNGNGRDSLTSVLATVTREEKVAINEAADAVEKQESKMQSTKTKTKAAPKRPVAQPKGTRAKHAKEANENSRKSVSGGKVSKLELIGEMLKRKQGCTTAEVLKATGWPSVSMPRQAELAGLKLKKEKEDGVTRYYAS